MDFFKDLSTELAHIYKIKTKQLEINIKQLFIKIKF